MIYEIGFIAYFIGLLVTQVFPTFDFKPFNCMFCATVWAALIFSVITALSSISIGWIAFFVTVMIHWLGSAGVGVFLAALTGYRYNKSA